MPSRRRSSSGYRRVRECPSGTYYVEIRSSDVCLGLGTFETAHEAARVYDAAAWRLGRPPAQMNFHDVYTREQAQDLAPSPSSDHGARPFRAPSATAAPARHRGGRAAHGGVEPAPPGGRRRERLLGGEDGKASRGATG
ncbi:putative AP2 protein [Hordeum vulgare]|nr:putative AP2 protein [Hordeum vulgare]